MVAGVHGQALALDGKSAIEIKQSAALNAGETGFTCTIWVNPFAPGGEQQMIAAKNRYSLGERQWGVMIDRDGLFRLYIEQGGWKTAAAKTAPQPGRWHLVGVVVRPGEAELWLDGRREGTLRLTQPIPNTAAPLTFDGVNDNGHLRQYLFGALDDAQFTSQPLPSAEMAALYTPVAATLSTPERPRLPKPAVADMPLWDESRPMPKSAELHVLKGVEFHVIKKHEPEKDGYSNSAGRRGNHNSAELAIIPLAALRVE